MSNTLKELLMKRVLPYVEVGVEFGTCILGSLRQNLQLRGFNEKQAQEIVLSILDFPKSKRR